MVIQEIEDLLNEGREKAGYSEKLSITFSNIPKLCDFQCKGVFLLQKKLEETLLMLQKK